MRDSHCEMAAATKAWLRTAPSGFGQPVATRLADWLAGWMVGWLVGCLVGRSVGGLAGWLAGWSGWRAKRRERLTELLHMCAFIPFFANILCVCPADVVVFRLRDCLFGFGRFADWLAGCMLGSLVGGLVGGHVAVYADL